MMYLYIEITQFIEFPIDQILHNKVLFGSIERSK